MRSHRVWRILPAFLLLLALTVPTLPAMAQDAGSILSVNTPSDGQMGELGQDVVFVGWAAHRAGAGTGVDRVMVLDAPMAAGGVVVAEATYGLARADVGTAYLPSWANSGFRATWRAAGSTGNRTFWVYAHSVDNDGWTNKTVTVRAIDATVPAPAAVAAAPVQAAPQTTNQATTQYGNQNGLYGNTMCDQYSSQYNQGQYNNQFMNQNLYNNQNMNQSQYCNQGGQYYNSQYPNQNGLYNNGQYQCDQYGNPTTAYNGYNWNQYNAQYPNYGSTMGYACSQYPTTAGAGFTVAGTTAADGTIVVTWAPFVSAMQGYRVYLMSPSTYLVATANQSFGASASATITGLSPNSAVTLQVRAVGGNNVETAIAGYSSNSPTAAAVAPPMAVTVGTKTSTTVALSWTPSVTGNITSYLVKHSTVGGTFTTSSVSNVTAGGALVGGLQASTTYLFEVTAITAGGVSSAPSTMVSAATTS